MTSEYGGKAICKNAIRSGMREKNFARLWHDSRLNRLAETGDDLFSNGAGIFAGGNRGESTQDPRHILGFSHKDRHYPMLEARGTQRVTKLKTQIRRMNRLG